MQSTLVECGWAATRKKDGFLKRTYEGLVTRRGKKKALVAVGHKIIIAAYHVIKNKEPYKEPKLHNNTKRKKKQIKNYLNKLKDLGYDISSLTDLRTGLKKTIGWFKENYPNIRGLG